MLIRLEDTLQRTLSSMDQGSPANDSARLPLGKAQCTGMQHRQVTAQDCGLWRTGAKGPAIYLARTNWASIAASMGTGLRGGTCRHASAGAGSGASGYRIQCRFIQVPQSNFLNSEFLLFFHFGSPWALS